MISPSNALKSFLSENPLPWLYWDEYRQKFMMIVDNHLLQTYRSCPQHFMNLHVLGLKRKTKAGVPGRVWFLYFGIALHDMLDAYYLNFRKPDFNVVEFCTKEAVAVWRKYNLDEFSEEKEYKAIGGVHGFIGLLVQYAHILSPENEKLRVLATEVSFGKGLEVLLGADEYVEIYLAGRADIIIDDGYFICPMDHKTKASFSGEVGLEFLTEEGPTGYIYALKTVLPSFVPEDMILKRDCSKILMNIISKAPTKDPKDRFKRIAIRKTEWQLEEYRLRMITTAKHLLQDMENFAMGLAVPRNTTACQNWMRRQCQYFDICRQQSADGQLVTINNGFVKAPIWDTQNVQN